MAAAIGDSRGKSNVLRIVNIDKDEVLKKLKDGKAKMHSKYVSRSVIFEIDTAQSNALNESEKRYNTWMKINDDNGSVSIQLRHMPSPRKLPVEHIISVSDFITAVKIARAVLHAVNYSYIEVGKETYDLDGRSITIIEWPYMKCELSIEGKSTADAMKVYRELRINGTISHKLDLPHSVYYRLEGLDFDNIRKHYNKKLDRLLEE